MTPVGASLRLARPFAFAVLALGLGLAPLGAQAPFRLPSPAIPGDARPFAAFDADGDGDQDLLTSYGIMLNDGGGRFTVLPGALPAIFDPAKTELAQAADIDLDGDQDLVVVWKPAATCAEVFYNGGGGVFGAPTSLFGYTNFTVGYAPVLVVGDFDGDGDADIASSNTQFIVHLQTAPGVFAFSTAAILAAAAPGLNPLLLGGVDLDGDGKTELVCDVGGSAVVVRHQTGFVSAPLAGGFQGAPLSSAVGDFDGDGRRDLVVCRLAGAGVVDEFVFQPGAIPFAIGHARSGAARLGALDVDGDGDDDVLRCVESGATVVDYATGAVLSAPPVLDALPTAATAIPFAPPGPRFVVFDAESDGDDDVAGRLGPFDYGVAIRRGLGGYLSSTVSTPRTLGSTVAADFDGDGDLDLARPAVAGGASSLALYRNDGHGGFGAPTVAGLVVSTLPAQLAAGDLDGDGLPDVVEFQNSGLPIVHRQTSPGVFTATTIGAFGSPLLFSIAAATIADVDADGDADILVVAAMGGLGPFSATWGLRVLLNAGGGTIASPTTLASFNVLQAAVLFADADAVPDFIVSGPPTGTPAAIPLSIYSGATGALIAFVGSIPTSSGYQGAVATGDLDGDGRQDVVAEGTAWLLAPGALTAVAAPGTLAAAWADRRRYVADVDADGIADVVEMSSVSAGVFYGLGGGAYSAASLFASDFGSLSPVFADLDRDGDPDLIDRSGRFRLNATASLSPGRPALIGLVGSFDLFGPANAPFDLFASLVAFAQNPVPIAGWGNLWLDPTQAVYVGPGSVGADGRTEILFALPNVPALAGLVLSWQAALPVTTRLTNVRTMPLSAP